jgi:hypothetical protein
LSTTKDGHLLVLALASKLELALANLHELFAPLNESLILSKDGLILIKVPSWLRGVLLNHFLMMQANDFPLLTALNGLLEVSHALLDLVTEHVFDVDLLPAPIDDLVGDLNKKRLHSLLLVVMLRKLPDDSDAVQDIRQKLWNGFRLSLTDLSAGLLQSTEESEVVLGLFVTFINLCLILVEVMQVRGSIQLQDVDDFLEIGMLKSVGYHLEIGGSSLPVVDFIQRRLNSFIVG